MTDINIQSNNQFCIFMSLESLGLGALFYGDKEEIQEQKVSEWVQDYVNKTLLEVETKNASKKISFTCIWLDYTKETIRKSRVQIREDQIPKFFLDVYDDLATIVDQVIKKRKYQINDRQLLCLFYPFATKNQTLQTRQWNLYLKEVNMPPQEQIKQLIRLTKKQNQVEASKHASEIDQLHKLYEGRKNEYEKEMSKLRRLCSDAHQSLLKQKKDKLFGQSAEKNVEMINKQSLSCSIVSMIQKNLNPQLILQQICISNNMILTEIISGSPFSNSGCHKEINVLNSYFKENTVTEFMIIAEKQEAKNKETSNSHKQLPQIKNIFSFSQNQVQNDQKNFSFGQSQVQNDEKRITISGFKQNGQISYQSRLSQPINTIKIQVDRFIDEIRFTNYTSIFSPTIKQKISHLAISGNQKIRIKIKSDGTINFKISVRRSDQYL